MKKTLLFAATCLLTLSTMVAQNSFKGIIKYKVESTGEVAFQIPAEAATAEIKVSGSNLYTKSAIFMDSPMLEAVLFGQRHDNECNQGWAWAIPAWDLVSAMTMNAIKATVPTRIRMSSRAISSVCSLELQTKLFCLR